MVTTARKQAEIQFDKAGNWTRKVCNRMREKAAEEGIKVEFSAVCIFGNVTTVVFSWGGAVKGTPITGTKVIVYSEDYEKEQYIKQIADEYVEFIIGLAACL